MDDADADDADDSDFEKIMEKIFEDYLVRYILTPCLSVGLSVRAVGNFCS